MVTLERKNTSRWFLPVLLCLAANHAWAEDAETAYGLNNLLQASPQIAGSIHSESSISDRELLTPSRLARVPQNEAVEASVSAVPTTISKELKIIMAGMPQREEAGEEAKEEMLNKPSVRKLSPRDRLLMGLNSAPAAAAPRTERSVPGVSDIGRMRAGLIASEVIVPARRVEGYVPQADRHDRGAGRLNAAKEHAQGYAKP